MQSGYIVYYYIMQYLISESDEYMAYSVTYLIKIARTGLTLSTTCEADIAAIFT